MTKVNAQEWAENWKSGISGSTTKVRRGIERTKKNPMQRAIAAIPKMQTNFNAAVADGRVERGFASVSFEEWRAKAINKGLPRIEQGAKDALPDVARVAAALIPHIDAGLAQLENMPSTTSGENKARMNYWFDHMLEAKGLG